MRNFIRLLLSTFFLITTSTTVLFAFQENEKAIQLVDPSLQSLVQTVDLDIGESITIELHDGSIADVQVISVEPAYDSVVRAIRDVKVTVRVNGEETVLHAGNYNLPIDAGGIQIDCPVTVDYVEESTTDWWGLRKDVRLRLWPEESPYIWPGTFVYPVDQQWLASMTWYSNEPVSLRRPSGKIYYHAGMDIGGAEDMVQVLSATDGIVVSVGDEVLSEEPDDNPIRARYDVIYVRDARGWYYRYSHLHSLDPDIEVGQKIQAGTRLGMLGKEGGSGGWTHLHFHIESRQPSGLWGIQDSYAFLWQAYRRQFDPDLMANARPHKAAFVGETVTLSGRNSWSRHGIRDYEWILSDGSVYQGMEVEVAYELPGLHSEILKIEDNEGHVDYDFGTVRVFEEGSTAEEMPASIHATFYPNRDIRPGDSVFFQVRFSGAEGGRDRWDFGDGSEPVEVISNLDPSTHARAGYSLIHHRFSEPGDYLVQVKRESLSWAATTYLHVTVVE